MKKIKLTASLLAFFLFPNLGFSQTNTSQIFVDGVCGMCKTRIETAALKVKGVKEADWNIAARMLTLTINKDKYDEDRLCKAIATIGHDNSKYKASDEAYATLHACCKYREEHH